jgi:outer membrane protein OmpA-like peptidoglycan-associated protein
MIASASRRWFLQGLMALAFVANAQAQGRYDVEAFEPAPQVEGSVLSLYGARSIKPGGFSVSLFGSYANEPLVIRDPNGDKVGELVGSVGTVQLLGAIGLFKRVDLGVALALHHTSAGSDFGDARLDVASLQDDEFAFGDIRVAPRVSIIEHDGSSGIDLAFVLPLWIPTGNDASYAGEPFRIEPRVALDFHSDAAVIVLNAGYMARKKQELVNTVADDQVKLGLGADVRLAGGLGVLAQLDTRLNVLADKFGDEDIDTELLAGLRYKAGGFRAQIGAGPGLVHAITTPEYRVFAGVSYSHEPEEAPPSAPPPAPVDRDSDNDGVPDAVDRCVDQAEDTDGFQDEDGCPDADPAPAPPAVEPAPPPAPAAPAALELTQVVRFDKNESAIATSYESTLDEIAKQLADHPEVEIVAIEGHADDRGSPELNDRLSRSRAEAVRTALVKRGVAKKRLKTQGFGTTRPVASNDTEDSRAQNRRVELRIEKQSEPKAAP